MTLVQGTAPDPRRQYVWWRGSWWTWAYGSWYLYTEARQSQGMHRLPSRTASGGHCVLVPEAVDRIASQRVHAQANAHSATGSARNCWLCPRPVDILSCAGLRLDHRLPGAGRAESRRNRGLCKCPSNTSDASPASSNWRVICVAEVPGGVGAG